MFCLWQNIFVPHKPRGFFPVTFETTLRRYGALRILKVTGIFCDLGGAELFYPWTIIVNASSESQILFAVNAAFKRR